MWLVPATTPAVLPTRWVHILGGTPATAPELYTRPAREPDGSGHSGGLNQDFIILGLRDSNGASNGFRIPGQPPSEPTEFTVHVEFDPQSDLTWPDDYRVYEDRGTHAAPNRVELLPTNGVFSKTVPVLEPDAAGELVRTRIYVAFQEDEVPEGLGVLIMRIVDVDSPAPGAVEVGVNNRVRWLVEDDDVDVTIQTLPSGSNSWKGGE